MARERRSGWWPRPQVLLWTCAGIAVILSLAGIIASDLDTTTEGPTPQQRTIILKLQSVLLHDSADPQYARVSLQPDGRGYVAGIGDFATGDGSALKVVDAYTARAGANVLSRDYGAVLARLAETRSAETIELDGYADAWRTATRDPVFLQVQDTMLHAMYLEPAISVAQEQGIRSALGVAVFFDSLLQHGDSSSPDALPALIARTDAAVGASQSDTADEHAWVARFLDIRESTLLNPAEPAHELLWPLTVTRVRTLQELVRAGAWELTPPVLVNPYGTAHALDASPPQVALSPPLRPSRTTSQTASPEPTGSLTSPPFTPGPSSPPAPTPLSTGAARLEGAIVGIAGRYVKTVGLRSEATGWCIDSALGNTWTTPCAATLVPSHLGFRVITTPWDGYYNLADVSTGWCLDGNGVDLYTNPCNWNNSYQAWNLFSGHLTIMNLSPGGRCIDGDKGRAYMNACNWNNDFQNWRLVTVVIE